MLNVFCLGSCRVVQPLKKLHRGGLANFVNADYSWYAHTAKEMVQRIQYMTGELDIPGSKLALIHDMDSCPTDYDVSIENFSLPRVGVFEISTTHNRVCDGLVLHSMLIRKQDFKEFEVETTNDAELAKELDSLVENFDHVILCCNIALSANLEEKLPHRVQLNDVLAEYAVSHDNVEVFNPNRFIDQASVQLTDHNHFSDSFTLTVTQKMGELLADVERRLG